MKEAKRSAPRMPLIAALLLCAAAFSVLVSCSDPCEELSQKICSCYKDNLLRHRCDTIVSIMIEADPPSDSQQSRCEDILSKWGSEAGCSCDLVLSRGEIAAEACGFVEITPSR